MKRPSIFHALPDCGCGGGTSTQVITVPDGNGGTTTTTTTTSPYAFAFTGSTICSDTLLTLTKTPRIKLLGAGPESRCMSYLDDRPAGVATPGFVVMDGTGQGATISSKPEFTLPAVNGANGFKSVMVATEVGAATPWGFITPPPTGTHVLQARDGAFYLDPAGSLPGMNAVCEAATADEVTLTGCINGASVGQYETRKLTAIQDAPVVGISLAGKFRSLPWSEPLKHPIMHPDTLRVKTYSQRDNNGNEVTGGIPVLPVTGVDAPGDAVAGMYSPSKKIFYRAPAQTRASMNYSEDKLVPDNGQWQAMGGHAILTNVQVNYPALVVMASIRAGLVDGGGNPLSSGNYNMHFGIFVDGVETFVFNPKGARDNTIHRIISGITPGVHTIEVRVRKDNVAGQNLRIRESNMDVFTVLG